MTLCQCQCLVKPLLSVVVNEHFFFLVGLSLLSLPKPSLIFRQLPPFIHVIIERAFSTAAWAAMVAAIGVVICADASIAAVYFKFRHRISYSAANGRSDQVTSR